MKIIVRDGVSYRFQSSYDKFGIIQKEAIVVKIGSEAGQDVKIPSKVNDAPVTTIQERACFGNKIIKTLLIPRTITHIGNYAFEECSYLEFVSRYNYSSRSLDLLLIGKFAFAHCLNLHNFLAHSKILTDDCSFYCCKSLSIFEAEIEECGKECFHTCTALKEISLGDNCLWGKDAFHNCKFENVKFAGTICRGVAKQELNAIKKFKITCTSKFNYLDWAYDGTNLVVL